MQKNQWNFQKLNPRTHQDQKMIFIILPWSSRLHARDAEMVQYREIQQCNPLYKHMQRNIHMNIFTRCWESIWQYSASIHDKSLGKIRSSRLITNIVKATYSKPVAKIKLNGEKLEAIPLKSKTRQGCSLFRYLFIIVLEILAWAIRQQKDVNEILIGKEVKISLFADNMIVHFSDLNSSTTDLLQLIYNFSKVSNIKIRQISGLSLLRE